MKYARLNTKTAAFSQTMAYYLKMDFDTINFRSEKTGIFLLKSEVVKTFFSSEFDLFEEKKCWDGGSCESYTRKKKSKL